MCAAKPVPRGQVAVQQASGEQLEQPILPFALDADAEKKFLESIVQQALQLEKDGSRIKALKRLQADLQKTNDRTEYHRLFKKAVEENQTLKECLAGGTLAVQFQNMVPYLMRLGIPQSDVLAAQLVHDIQTNRNQCAALEKQIEDCEEQHKKDQKRLKQILKEQSDTWDEDKAGLQKDLRRLKDENRELLEQLEFREKEIKNLKKQLAQLEEEKSVLEQELKKMKGDLSEVKDEMYKLEADVTSLKLENQELQSDLHKSQETHRIFTESVNEKISKLETKLTIVQETNTEEISETDTYFIALSEICTMLQTCMYKKVHPSIQLGRSTQRTVKELMKHITSQYKDDPDGQEQANRTWEELKATLDWDDEYMQAMKDLKSKRNLAAHPPLDDDMIPGYVGYVKKLKRDGSISENLAKQAEALINMFCKLKDLNC